MTIEVTIQPYFKDLKDGDVFFYPPSGVMWLKMSITIQDGLGKYNAVSLDDGTPAFFEDDDMVIFAPTKLVSM